MGNPIPPPAFRELIPAPDVLGVFEHVSRLSYPLLFDSATAGMETVATARFSYVVAEPRTVVRAKGMLVETIDVANGTIVRQEGKALDVARSLVRSVASADETLPPFCGGLAGYVGYEYGAVLEQLPAPHADDLTLPDVLLGVYDWTIAWDHAQNRAWVMGLDAAAVEQGLQAIAGARRQSARHDVAPDHPTPPTSTFSRAAYERAIERVREYIRAGDIFQANLSQRFAVPYSGTPWTLYRHLRDINPAPFGAFFDLGDFAVVSISPERFLACDATGHVETRPIKGTRPRATSTAEDDRLRDELLQSPKDAAEHVMIVDVLRNDLARVCEFDTVRVPSLMVHERHATVHHLVSTVTGQLRTGADSIDLLHACFPGGSITGAPKIRAMEIIAELEPVTRGVYCGAIGWISATGAMDTNIAIRTCVVKNGCAFFSAGGGIVADSDSGAEYDETLHKAYAMMRALGVAP